MARLKPCPSRLCYPRMAYRLRRLYGTAEAAPFLASPIQEFGSITTGHAKTAPFASEILPETKNSPTISGGKGTTLSRADMGYPRRGFSR